MAEPAERGDPSLLTPSFVLALWLVGPFFSQFHFLYPTERYEFFIC